MGKPISFDRRTISAKPGGCVGEGIELIGLSKRNWSVEFVQLPVEVTRNVTAFN